ncbi:MAG: DUF2336 domain-containing protein [Alphaproteobacteria bacterium]|nr:DUF2336 domain-containing protein [Alphaproteobacteria bacterium]MCZ6840258.1 DUF2336 domain-containing protein [Alphaproteobacteria bacterium]
MNDAGPTKVEIGQMAYLDQKRLAHDGNFEVRRKLAQRDDVRPEILYYLASDPDTEVRRNIARNLKAPRHADLLLAKDEKDEVRTDVAGKIADITVNFADGQQDNIYRLTMDALEVLARDQLVRVREILAETLKECPQAPVDVMERLARDREITVSQPVLENSPVLSEEFLVSVISSDPVHGTLSAIARRVALGEDVADAIVHNGDAEAIAALLGNESTQIREETLDRIVDQASGEPTWHKPLVHRPNLHAEAAMRIAEIVAAPLLDDLGKRGDLDADTISAIKEVVLRRLDSDDFTNMPQQSAHPALDDKHSEESELSPINGTEEREGEATLPANQTPENSEDTKESVVTKRVRQMYLNDELNDHEISSALASGGQEFVIYAVALKSKTPVDVVSRAISMRSAKAIVALCWKADLSMRLATRVQMHLAHIPPSDVLRATASEDFPLSSDEMRWQLEFISGLTTAG